jgi:hypothetical protein
MSTNPFETRMEGPSPAAEVARDMVRRGLPLLPIGMILGALVAGFAGAASVTYGMTIILVNTLLSAYLLGWASRISFVLVAVAAFGGYLVRLGLIFLAVWLVKDASWIALVPLGVTMILTHLGLLVWELRYVSASLAHPGLKPTKTRRPASAARR